MMNWLSKNPFEIGQVVYRLTKGCHLPLHWAYGDPFYRDYEEGVIVDAREEGAQVWDTLTQVARALAGEEMDGLYMADEYPTILVLQVNSTRDSGGDWNFVTPMDVKATKEASSEQFLDRIGDWLGANGDEVLDLLHEELDDRGDEEVEGVLESLLYARPCEVVWMETLPAEDHVGVVDWPVVRE